MTLKFDIYKDISKYLEPEELERYIEYTDKNTIFINDYASYQNKFNQYKNKIVRIQLPIIDTKIPKPKKLEIVIGNKDATAEAYTAEERNIVDLSGLDDININKIKEGRTSKEGEVYSVNELKQIARRLKIIVPTKKKELVDAILQQLKIIGKLK